LVFLNEQLEQQELMVKTELIEKMVRMEQIEQQQLLQSELQLHYLLEVRQQLLMYELAKMLFLTLEYLKEIVELEVEM